MKNLAELQFQDDSDIHQVKYRFVKSRESSARTYANTIDRVMEKGYLSRIFDTEGNEYLDCLSCAGTLATGHNHPFILERVQKFLQSGQVLQALDITTPAKYDFLVKLFDCLPQEFAANARAQFCGPTGSDAVEAAIKLFKTATGRSTVLAFHGAYHGMTAGALALTGNLTAKRHVTSNMPDVHFLPYPYPYRCPFGVGSQSHEISLNYIERMLSDPESGIKKPAAMIVEAIQGEGGVVPADKIWLQGIRRITQELDIPLIIDEIQTGFGRTGNMFAFEHAEIVPDAIVISKAVGGGFPLSVFLYNKAYDKWLPGAHAGTFRGNQIAMVAGTATMELIIKENLVEAAQAKGKILQRHLNQLSAEFPLIGEVRGRGLMWGIEIVNPHKVADKLGSFPADGDMARGIKRRCLSNGLIVETGGRHGAVLRLLPPLIISEHEIDELAEKLYISFKQAASLS